MKTSELVERYLACRRAAGTRCESRAKHLRRLSRFARDTDRLTRGNVEKALLTDGRLTLTEAPDAPSEPDLKAFGVQQIPETFEVELLNSKKMILKSTLLRISFKKY